MTLKVTQDHQQWQILMGHISLPVSGV